MKLNQELVELIYDIPLGDSCWEEVVHELKNEFSALIAFMLIMRPKQAPVIISTISNEHALWQSYGEYFHSIDPLNDLATSGKIARNTCHYDPAILKSLCFYQSEYYNDFWKPHGLYHTGGGLMITRNHISIVLGFPREKSLGPYEADEAQMMTYYGRQLVKAIELEGLFGVSLPNNIYALSLTASYGLSNAESRLVRELFKCCSLPEASTSLNRSYHTVRNQMKSIFNKTETSNQLELFKLLASPQR